MVSALEQTRDNLDAVGCKVRIVFTDNIDNYQMLMSIWPGAFIRQDIWHLCKRLDLMLLQSVRGTK